ncbi:unnamed protein product [Paramecium primaurelia]|uniref:NPHP4 Ig-like domain-containing protein n=1 Tax=Paramecium primaurelia TaxID=5886 RepID=A0A8S1K7L9_PARPR|nr:unnamed protein product [Paramecium primaurelia]
MLSDYELQQQALKQKLARQQAQEQINSLESKLQQIIQIQKEIEEQDFQYQIKCDDLQKKREQQMKEIQNLRASQEADLQRTRNMYNEMWKMAEKFQKKQQQFIYQQKLDKDQLKSFQVTQTSKQSHYEMNKELVVPHNPFVLLSQAQGFLDSQYDAYYETNYPKLLEIVEKESLYPKSQIQITFVSFKPDMPTLEQFEKRRYEGTVNQIPLSMQLLIDFYDFPTYKSNTLIYEDCPTIEQIRRQVGYDQELKLAYEDYFTNKTFGKKACFVFEVENDLKFVYYLLFKNAYIRVLDAITGENYGYCQIPLNSLIREDKSDVFSIQEVQVLSYDWTITYGIFTITIQNIGISQDSNVATLTNFDQNAFSQTLNIQSLLSVTQNVYFNQVMDNKSKIQTQYVNLSKITSDSAVRSEDRIKIRISQLKPQSQISQARKKITSDKPKDLTEYGHQAVVNLKINDVDERMRVNERIKSKRSDVLTYLSTKDDFLKLQAVELSRKWDRYQILSSVLPSHMIPNNLYLPVGEKCIQFIEYQNDTDEDKIITVEISPPIITYLVNGEELESIYETKGIAFHSRVEVEQDSFKCHAQQKCIIAIIFYTLIEFTTEIEVAVYLKQKQQPICGSLYKVIPKSQVIDMNFDFYRQPNSQIELYLPQVFCFCEIKYRKTPIIICNREEVTFAINPDDMRIKLELKTADIGKQIILLLFFYRDKHCHYLLLSISVKITSLTLIKLSTVIGQATSCQTEFKSDKKRQIYFHSLNQDKIWFESPFDKPIWVEQNQITIIPFKVFQMTSNSHIVKVNAMDSTTNEMVYSWLFQISSNMPQIKRVFTFDCYFRQPHPFKITYANSSGKVLNLNIVSSSYLLKVFQSQIKILIGGKAELEIAFMKAEEYPSQDFNVVEKQREILLFIYEIKNNIFECYLFQFNLYDKENENISLETTDQFRKRPFSIQSKQ